MFNGAQTLLPQALSLVVVVLVGILSFGLLTSRMKLPRRIRLLGWASFALHLILGCVLIETLGLGSSDALHYHELGVRTADYLQGNEGVRPELTEGKEGWIWLLGVVYALTAPAPVLGVAINSLLLALGLCLSYKLTLEISSSELTARTAAWLFFAVPGHWLWGSMPLREASAAFLLAAIALFAYRSYAGGRLSDWVLLGASLLGLLSIRGSVALLVGVAVAVAFCVRSLASSASVARRLATMTAALACGLVAMIALESAKSETSVDRIGAIRSSQNSNATTAFQTRDASATDGILSMTFESAPRILFGPFPQEWPAVLPLMQTALFWFLIIFLAAVASLGRNRYRGSLLLLLPCGAILIALAVYSGNYGTMMRLRDQALPLLIPLAALGWTRLNSGSSNCEIALAGPVMCRG